MSQQGVALAATYAAQLVVSNAGKAFITDTNAMANFANTAQLAAINPVVANNEK